MTDLEHMASRTPKAKSLIALVVLLGLWFPFASQAHDSLGTHPHQIAYSPKQIVTRLNAAMANPARYARMFEHDPGFGRLATVTNCSDVPGAPRSVTYRCDLEGLPAGVTSNVMISTVGGKVTSVVIAVESRDDSSVGLAAMTFILAQTAVIIAVDPHALRKGMAAKPQVTRIVEQLTPKAGNRESSVTADGLLFTQRFVGDWTLDVTPAQ